MEKENRALLEGCGEGFGICIRDVMGEYIYSVCA